MPLYFFNTHNGNQFVKDCEGSYMADREAARREAHVTLGHMAKDEMPDGDMRNLYVNVYEENGGPIYTVCMSLVGRWLN